MKIAALVVLALALGPVGLCRAAEIEPIIPKAVPTVRLVQERQSKAVLYEEDANDPNGRQFVGSAVWRTDPVPPGAGQAPELTIRADIEIPGRGIALHWSLRRNQDKALPASHVVEIVFTLPPDFSHGGIANIPGVLMKEAESTTGVPLAGVGVKAAANLFLISLSTAEADIRRNIQLLKERSWFDIPVAFDDGRRAIIAVEKGPAGERAFADAFTSWGVSKTLPPFMPGLADRAEPSKQQPEREGKTSVTSGTGFFVTDHGHVVTAAHVVDGCIRIAIRYDGATSRAARLDQLEKTDDVALLDTDVTPVRVAKWRPAVRLGEDVVVYGFPWSGVLATDGNVTTGIITALAGLRDDIRFLQFSAPVQRGNSGGPVLDRFGNVVGIVVAKLDVARFAEQFHDTAQNVNFAVKSGVALRALRVWGTAVPEGRPGATFSTPDLVDFAKAFTVNVFCERTAERPPRDCSRCPAREQGAGGKAVAVAR
jgi:S1-C subfamily serine protease